MRRHIPAVVLGTLLLVAAAMLPLVAGAAETREVGGYVIEIGFREEPAYLEEANAVEIRIRDLDGAPVYNAHQTLDLRVSARFREQVLPLRPLVGEPGAYEAPFIPPFTGEYDFTLAGSIDGQPLNELVRTGDGGLPSIEARTSNDYSSPGAYIAYGTLLVYLVGLGGVAYWFYGRRRHGDDIAAA